MTVTQLMIDELKGKVEYQLIHHFLIDGDAARPVVHMHTQQHINKWMTDSLNGVVNGVNGCR
jgi:hypothetical protein